MDHVADANARLSLLGLSIGYLVTQDDSGVVYQYNGDAEAVQIIGAGTEAANGYYTKRGTKNGKGYYQLIGIATDFFSHFGAVEWTDTDEWRIYNAGGDSVKYSSVDAVAYPWLVTTWTEVDGSAPVPTTAHIASKNALTTCAFVSGAGTTAANGIYTERPALGNPVAGRKVYNLLGQTDNLANYAIFPGAVTKWTINDSSGSPLYTTTDNVNFPWLVTTWISVPLDDVPTVVSKTQGELDAGVLVTGAVTGGANDVYPVTGDNENKNEYTGLASSLLLHWITAHGSSGWFINDADPHSDDDTAFPWEASFNDSATVAEDLIASESNWEPLDVVPVDGNADLTGTEVTASAGTLTPTATWHSGNIDRRKHEHKGDPQLGVPIRRVHGNANLTGARVMISAGRITPSYSASVTLKSASTTISNGSLRGTGSACVRIKGAPTLRASNCVEQIREPLVLGQPFVPYNDDAEAIALIMQTL